MNGIQVAADYMNTGKACRRKLKINSLTHFRELQQEIEESIARVSKVDITSLGECREIMQMLESVKRSATIPGACQHDYLDAERLHFAKLGAMNATKAEKDRQQNEACADTVREPQT